MARVYTYPSQYRKLFERYTCGPSLIREAVRDLDSGAVNRRAPGSDWNVRDILLHLADTEILDALRLRIALAGEGGLLPEFDGALWKRRLQYLWRSPEAALNQVEALRFGTAEMLSRSDASEWSREATLPSGEPVSVHGLVARAVAHTDEHVAGITEARRGSVPR